MKETPKKRKPPRKITTLHDALLVADRPESFSMRHRQQAARLLQDIVEDLELHGDLSRDRWQPYRSHVAPVLSFFRTGYNAVISCSHFDELLNK